MKASMPERWPGREQGVAVMKEVRGVIDIWEK
jgi:hypothetical protein